MTQLVVRLLGTFAVQRDARPVASFRSVKNQALLAYLAMEADRPQTRAALAGLLWPDQPEEQAYLNLRQALFRIRHVLENDHATPPFLQVSQASVQFDAASDHWLDASAFANLLEACHVHARGAGAANVAQHRRNCRACVERLMQAVELYAGEFLHGIYVDDSPGLEEWLLLRREWFAHQALDALFDLAAWHTAQGEYGRAYHFAWRQLALDPLREEAYRQSMLALALDGKRSEAVAQYEACAQTLYDELGVMPAPETEALLRRIEGGELQVREAGFSEEGGPQGSERAPLPPPRHNLPVPGTSFLGRDAEVQQLRELLLDPAHRLVTITGPGGVGKTRLALAAAAALTDAFADGARFVPLVGVDTGDGLSVAVAGALGHTFAAAGEPQAQLLDYLRSREVLIVLDNFEQLMAATSVVQTLIERAPRTKLLVTSRERLRLQSEMPMAVAGLPAPVLAGDGAAAARSFSSVQLFAARASRASPDFALDDATLPSVVEICRLVEGLPLGIELAASWTEHFACAEIAQAIQQNLDFLSTSLQDLPARHRSLRAVFDYSRNLLTAGEQAALAQVAVFRATFSREAALAVTQVALPQLAGLVNKSLLRAVGQGRYSMHELVRQFAAEALEQMPDAVEVHHRHAWYYLALVARQEELFGPTPHKAVLQLQPELDNVRQAWRWAAMHADSGEVAPAVANLARILDLAGLYREAVALWELAAVRWPVADALSETDALLACQLAVEQARTNAILGNYTAAVGSVLAVLKRFVEPSTGQTVVLRAQALQQLAIARFHQGDRDPALPLLVEAVALARRSGDTRLTAECLVSLGEVEMVEGGAAGRDSLEEALACYRSAGDRRGEGAALQRLGMIAQMQSDFATGQHYCEEALRIHRALGDWHNEAVTLTALAGFHARQNRFDESDRTLRQTLQLARTIGYRTGEVQALISLGTNQWLQGQAAAARVYFEQALPIARACGYLRGEGAILNNLGNLASDARAFVRAEGYYLEALEVSRRGGDRYMTCSRLHNLGNMRRFQGDYVGAQRYYADAAAMAAAIDDRWIEGSARADLGLACALLGDPVQAQSQLRQALILAREIGDRWCEAKALAALGWQLVVHDGDAHGLATIDEAIALAQAAHEVGIEGNAHAKHGHALLHLGRLEEAAAAFARSIALRRQSNEPVQIMSPLAGLAVTCVALGQRSKALEAVEEVLRLAGDQPVGVADDPLRVYAACWQVLVAAGDSRAEVLRTRAWAHMEEQALQIEDADSSARFLARCMVLLGGNDPGG